MSANGRLKEKNCATEHEHERVLRPFVILLPITGLFDVAFLLHLNYALI